MSRCYHGLFLFLLVCFLTLWSGTAQMTGDDPIPTVTANGQMADSITILFGNQLSLSCSLDSDIEATLEWIGPDNQPINSNTSFDDVSLYTNNINISVTNTAGGVYTCNATSSNGTGVDSIIVTVSIPAPEVTVALPFLSFDGASLVTGYINCTVISITRPNVTWTVDDPTVVLQQPELVMEAEATYSSRLFVDRAILGSTNKEFTCTAVNENSTAGSDSGEISVMNTPPTPTVTANGGVTDTITVGFGDELVLSCTIDSAINVTLSWTGPDDQLLTPTPSYDGAFMYSSNITISVTVASEGSYTCRAMTDAGVGEDDISVTVTVPDPNVTITPGQLTVPYNASISLTCQATSLITANITWSTSAANIALPDPGFSLTGDVGYTSTLELSRVTTDHTGTYYCSVSNQRTVVNDTASLEVYVPPPEVTVVPSSSVVMYFTAASLVTGYINCTVISFTRPNVTWTVDDPMVTLQQPELVMETEEATYTSSLFVDRVILGSSDKMFTCTAVNENGTANSDSHEIHVINDPPIPTITANGGVTDTISLSFGDELVLSCTADSAINVTFTWTGPGNQPLNPITSYDGAFMYSSNITISVTDASEGSYTCRAISDFDSGEDNITVTVTVPEPMIQPIPDQAVTIGHNATFVCNASSDLNLTYEWTFQPRLFNNCHDFKVCFLGEYERELTILSVVVAFNSNVTCNATDTRGQSTIETAQLIVNGIELESQSDTTIVVRENTTLVLNCTFSHPNNLLVPVTVNWTKESTFINPSTEDNLVISNNEMMMGDRTFIETQLTIIDVEPFYDSNPLTPFNVTYNCIATPEGRHFDEVKSPTIQTHVLYTPILNTDIETNPLNPTRINRNDTRMVSCNAIGNPTPGIVFEEVFPDGTVMNLTTAIFTGKVSYVIDIPDVSEHLYRCAATNEFGTRIQDFRVIIQDRPEPVNSATIVITLLSFFTVRVEWTPPFDNLNNITSYNIMYVERIDRVGSMTRQTMTNNITINGLGTNTDYDLIIFAVNGVGQGLGSTAVPLNSISSRNASLTDVIIPSVLITANSFFVQWKYPALLTDPIITTDTAVDVKHVSIDITSNSGSARLFTVDYDPLVTSTTINEGINPDSRITITVNIVYNNPDFQGNQIAFERDTLPSDGMPVERPVVNNSALTGANPVLQLSWTPLSPDNGLEFLQHYVVSIAVSQLPQTSRLKRQTSSNTMEIIVDKTESSFEFDAEPFTSYTSQIFSQLNVNGVEQRIAITAPTTQETTESAPESAPRNISYSELSFTSVTLSWELPATPNGFISSYTIYRSSENNRTEVVATETRTSHTTVSLIGGVMYSFRITGSNTVGESPSASIDVTTPSGVYPPGTPSITAGSGDTLIVRIPDFSTLYGPLSHYLIVVVTNDNLPSNISTIYDNGDNRWRDLGYYATAAIPANNDNRNFTVGDGSHSTYNGIAYYNVPLSKGTEYSIFIRLFSSASNPIERYRDSRPSNKINIPVVSTLNVASVVIPIVVILLVLVLIIVVIIIVIIFLRRPPRHTETFYLDEIKATSMKPSGFDTGASPPRNGTNRNNNDGRTGKITTPSLAVQSSEIYTSVGQPTIILCEVTGTPTPEVIWSKDGRTLQGSQYRILADGSLYVLDTELKDDGNYVVSAYNDGGNVEESVRVVVIAPLAPESDPNHPSQTVSEFIERMALLHSTMDEQLEDEYHEIELEWNVTVYNAKLPVNHNKNRYVNIVPYDHSRVVLSIQDNASGSDYINGSFIDGYNETNSYMATQGPIPASFPDFWRMLWEYDVPTIVMVTNLKEDEKIKCHQYWPSYGATNYGDFQVNLKEVENIVDYSIRTFQIQMLQGGASKEIRQFHFQVWPDHGVPQYATALLGFRKRIRNYHPTNRGPMAVHCSAGVGRTGTFICIDTMMNMIEAEGKIDIFNFVRHMRFRRNYMVQTSTQYEFIHEALLETIMCGDTSLPVKSLSQRVLELGQVDPITGKSGFLTQLQTLESSSPSDEEFDCSVAQIPDNLSKTRAHKHLPPNDNRVVLSTKKYDSDYICASFIDGYRQRQCFITTQGPMKNTAGDFWRMVWEYNTSTIVMLTQLEEGGEEQCVQYWPNTGQEIWGSFVVEKSQEEDRVLPEYTVRKFNIRHIDNSDEVRSVSQFHYTNWSHDACPTSAVSINDMIGEVLRIQRKSGNNPITVHCSDGLGRTGTFCAMFTILERVKAEQVVDVFSTVKSLRIQRPGLLESLDQYEFIHKVVMEFLTTFDNYNNFKLN